MCRLSTGSHVATSMMLPFDFNDSSCCPSNFRDELTMYSLIRRLNEYHASSKRHFTPPGLEFVDSQHGTKVPPDQACNILVSLCFTNIVGWFAGPSGYWVFSAKGMTGKPSCNGRDLHHTLTQDVALSMPKLTAQQMMMLQWPQLIM